MYTFNLYLVCFWCQHCIVFERLLAENGVQSFSLSASTEYAVCFNSFDWCRSTSSISMTVCHLTKLRSHRLTFCKQTLTNNQCRMVFFSSKFENILPGACIYCNQIRYSYNITCTLKHTQCSESFLYLPANILKNIEFAHVLYCWKYVKFASAHLSQCSRYFSASIFI